MSENLYNVEFLDSRGCALATIQQKAGYKDEAKTWAFYRLQERAGMEIDYAVNALHNYKEIRVTFLKKVEK